MSATTDLNTTWETKAQAESTIAARTALEEFTNAVNRCDNTIQKLVDSGEFDTIPKDLKAKLNAWWTILKTAQANINADDDILAIYNWRP